MIEKKYFDVLNGNNKILEPKKDLDFSRYLGFHTFSKLKNKEIVNDILQNLNIETNQNFINDLPNISFEIRNNIKKIDKNLLELLDNPDFLLSYIYILVGFSIGKNTDIGKDGINTINSLTGIIINLLKNQEINSNSFFCAHRENKIIERNKLVSDINIFDFNRVQNLVYGILENSPNTKDFSVNFYNIGPTISGVNSIFPNIFLNYLEKNEIYKLFEILESHIFQLNQNKYEKTNIFEFDIFSEKVKSFLTQKYGNSWQNFTQKDLVNLSNYGDFLAKITLENTVKDFSRIDNIIKDFFHQKTKTDVENIIKKNIENTNPELKQKVEESLKYFQNYNNIYSKSFYETAFYYFWGKETLKENSIALGFDRDHDFFQTKSFEAGYGDENFPLLYAKRTGKKSENKINSLSFRQFWHF